MSEKIKVGMRGQVVIPKKFRKKLKIERGIILEINATDEGLFLKPFNPVAEMKGLGKGFFSEAVEYQKKLREEWECQPKPKAFLPKIKKNLNQQVQLKCKLKK